MPELKRNFMQGRMNKDLDERIIPDGEYRDALNIEVSTAEESSVGTVRNIPGNQLKGSLRLLDRFWLGTSVYPGDPDGYKYNIPDNGSDFADSCETVGAITDPANNTIYSFLASVIEPHAVPAGNRSSISATTAGAKTASGSVTNSKTVTISPNATDVEVGMVMTGAGVNFGSTVQAINGAVITLNKTNDINDGVSLTFSKAALEGYDVDCILQTKSDEYQATYQSDRLQSIFTDVYNVYRVPANEIPLWATGNDVQNTTGSRGGDITTIYMQETANVGSATGNMNFANGIYRGANVELILDGVNILTPNLINPITNKPIGTVKVKNVSRGSISVVNGLFGVNNFSTITLTLDKAIPANLITSANISNGLYYKFSNERLLNFNTGTPLDYTETNSSGTTLIAGHPTPINTKITGIDIIEDTLYFTDGKTEPKRIDIKTSIKGSNYVINTNAVNNLGAEPARAPMLFETSQLEYKNPISQEFGYIFEGIGRNTQEVKNYELEDITVIRRHPLNPPTVDLLRSKRVGITHGVGLKASTGISSSTSISDGATVTFTVTKNKARDFAFPSFYTGTVDGNNNLKNHSWRVGDVLSLDTMHDYSPTASSSPSDSGSRNIRVRITGLTNGSFSMPSVSNTALYDYHDTTGAKVVNHYRDAEHGYYDFDPSTPTYTKYNDILTVTAEIIDKNKAMSRANLSATGVVYFEASLDDVAENPDPVLFKEKFPRFAIRYKYDDNQFSAISPFTEPCFLPKINYSWDKEEGQNKAMENSIKKIVLRDFITPSTPVDVKQIDVLVKFDGENNIYKVGTIKKGSKQWNNDNGKFAKTVLGPYRLVQDATLAANLNVEFQRNYQLADTYENRSYGNTRGVFEVLDEKLGAVIPSNQILRPFDAVPTTAKAQCVSANRLVYANYTLDYDLVTSDGKQVVPRLYYGHKDPNDSTYRSFREGSFSNKGNYRKYGTPEPNIKGGRTYTLGISFLDRFGRQSPVITGPESSYTTPYRNGMYTARLRAKLDLDGGIPYWATDYRYYIKETSNEYYNIALFRAYPAEGNGTNEANRTTAYWLAFHSADRNKIQEDSVLRLKSRGGGGSATAFVEKAYRVLAISNEAPAAAELDLPGGGAISPKRRKGKFYVKVQADENLIRGLKGPFGGVDSNGDPELRFGGVLSDYNTPAIFEVVPDPDIGLNIFYEIPRTYPIKLTQKNIEDFINFNDFFACYRTGYDTDGSDHSKPTFRAVDSNGESWNNPHGTGTKPNELFHKFDNKLLPVIDDLKTRVLHIRGSELEDGVQRLQLDNQVNIGVPILTSGNTHYLAGLIEPSLTGLVSDLNYTGNPAVAGEFSERPHPGAFGAMQIFRLDGTRSTMNINNVLDGLPSAGRVGMNYNSFIPAAYNFDNFTVPFAGGTASPFSNVQSYTNTNTIMFDSLVFSSEHLLPFYNCWHFGNGVESDRIRDDFNAPMLDNGVKASSTAETYGQKVYKHGLIFSGLYNSKTDVNNLNQFIKAEGITKDLNPEYGSIQKLFTRNTNVLAFCENKVLKILSNKDALFNADGNTNVTSNKAVLGTAVPFSGDHGISRNPESFAEDEFRCYFTDRDRGAVCRLSMDGITAISSIGMSDYFADELVSAVACVGAFNDKKGEYDLTIHNNLGVDDVDNDTTVDTTKRVQTISFNEKTNSWVSFRSYIIEQGVSLNNEYYTIKKGRVYLHSDDAANGRNNFYGTQYFSSVTPIFNDAPGSIKSFQTINYEGTQAQVIANSRTGTTNGAHSSTTTLTLTSIPTGLTVGQNVTGNDFTLPTSFQLTPITVTAINTATNELTLSSAVSIATAKTVVFSDAEYYNDDAYTGWYVESITTDKQEGEVLEFKEKEGKWFNSISGVATTFTNDVGGGGGTGNIDSQEFSVQGIGSLNSISGAGNSGLFYSSTVTATIAMSCGESATITGNTESNIPHGTNFGTYSSFDGGTGIQKVTICPPTGYSFVDPGTLNSSTGLYTAPTVAVDSVTLNDATTQADNIASTFTTSITQPTTIDGCIELTINWHNGYTPNANTSLSVALADDAAGTALQIYNYELPIAVDLIWEEGSSTEWSILELASIDSNMSTSPLTPQQATNNGEFATIVSAPSNNDLSSILSGNFDYSSVGQTFSVTYKAAQGNYFEDPIGNVSAQTIINSFVFPTVGGFPVGGPGLYYSTPANFYEGSSSHPGAFGLPGTGYFFDVTWSFSQYDVNGNAVALEVIYTFNPTSSSIQAQTNGLLGYWTYGCDDPSNLGFSTWGDPVLVWEPSQDIGGGEEPVIPDSGDNVGDGDDEFEFVDLPVEHTVNVAVTHQKNDGSASTDTTVQNDNFSVFSGQFLDQSTAQVIIQPNAGFTFNESQITIVDGNAQNAPVGGVATYTDGVSGDTLTANVQSITCEDLVVGGVTVVLVKFTFENVQVFSDLSITIIIKGDTTNLSAAEVSHRDGVVVYGVTSPEDNIQTVFGDGSSGGLGLVQAPDSNYAVATPAPLTTILPSGEMRLAGSVTGTSSIGVQRTIATVTLKTLAGHRFITHGDQNGFSGFLEDAGISLTTSSGHADRILAWLNDHISFIVEQSSNTPISLYAFEFAVTVTNSGASNVQEQIVVTIKYTGDGNVSGGQTTLFEHKMCRIQAADYNNPNYA